MNVDPVGSGGDAIQVPNRHSSASHRMKLLPLAFVPSEDDVICGRGKKCYSHVGNDRFRTRVHSVLGLYRSARTKLDKSKVLNMVVEQVRQNSPGGGFVKQDETGRWHEVGDFLAREKTSQAFRDALHENYKSSNVSKKKRRQEELSKASDKMKMPRSSMDIARKIESMSMQMKNSAGRGTTRSASFNHPSSDLMAGIHLASHDMRHDNQHHMQNPGFSPARLSNANERVGGGGGFEFEFEPDEPVDGQFESRSEPFGIGGGINSRGHMSADLSRGNQFDDGMMMRQRSSSVPNVPPLSQSFDFGEQEAFSGGSEEVHHSLPNIDFDPENLEMENSERMHSSAPNLCFYSPSELLQPDDAPQPPRAAEAPEVPTSIEFWNQGRGRGGGGQAAAGRQNMMHPQQQQQNQQQFLQHQHQQHGFMDEKPRGLVSSLERFAGAMEMEDDNPFEPIPISSSSQPQEATTMQFDDAGSAGAVFPESGIDHP